MKSAVEPLKARRSYLLLRDRIVAGELPPDLRLPGEPALATEHAVSLVTMRRALDLLEKAGLVQRKAGSGTFVHDTRAVRRSFSYLTTHVPEWIGLTYSEAELTARPLLELIERSGVTTEHATQVINATLAGPKAAAALDLEIAADR